MEVKTFRKIFATKDYRLFHRESGENRDLVLKLHRRLYRSMKSKGFLWWYPVVCCRNEHKQLVVKDGQHRLAFAEELGLTVYWVEVDVDYDVADANATTVLWKPRDYAERFITQGKEAYRIGLEFCQIHKFPIGIGFALLGGSTSWANVNEAFYIGEFVIKDQKWADSVATLYGPLVRMSAAVRNSRFLQACMACCRVEKFSVTRMLENAARCREKLLAYSTRDAYLQMMEDIYNYGRKSLVGLKAESMMAMRERNASVSKNGKEQETET